jgi:hypothetical protein
MKKQKKPGSVRLVGLDQLTHQDTKVAPDVCLGIVESGVHVAGSCDILVTWDRSWNGAHLVRTDSVGKTFDDAGDIVRDNIVAFAAEGDAMELVGKDGFVAEGVRVQFRVERILSNLIAYSPVIQRIRVRDPEQPPFHRVERDHVPGVGTEDRDGE